MPALESVLPTIPDTYYVDEVVEGEVGGNPGPKPFVVVLVGGFLVPPTEDFDEAYWGEAIKSKKQHQRVLVVHPSPIASLHDRVCQIFYELKGGQVNYGKGHSEKYCHDQYGEHHKGRFPEWDANNPVHLIGHSFGGLTVRLLLHYLENKAFVGHNTSGAWVRSITSLNSPHNGTHLVYGLGADPRHPPVVHWGSPGHLLGTFAHLVEYMDMDALRKLGIDFGLQYWKLSWRRGGIVPGFFRVLKAALGLSDVTTTPDNAAYEMTLHAAEHYNKITTTYPSVYYFSFVGTMPWQQRTGDGVGWARFMIKNISYLVMAAHVSLVDFKRFGIFDKQNVPRWLREGQSDGVVPVDSQSFPRGAPHAWGLPKDLTSIVSGIWYAQKVAVDHIGIVGYPTSSAYQAAFFNELYDILEQCQRVPPTPPNPRSREVGCSCQVSAAGQSATNDFDRKHCPVHGLNQTPSTRLMNCDVRLEELLQNNPPVVRGENWKRGAIAWCLAAVSVLMYALLLLQYPQAFLLSLVALEVLRSAGGSLALVLAPTRLDIMGQRLWKLNLLSIGFGLWSFIITTTLLLIPSLESSSSWLQSQLLLACAFYAHNLWANVRDGFFKRHLSTLAYQTLMLVLSVSGLHQGDLSSSTSDVLHLPAHLLILGMLGEIHTILSLTREVLILSGYLEIIENELTGDTPNAFKPDLISRKSSTNLRRRPSFTTLSEDPNGRLKMSLPRSGSIYVNSSTLASRKRVASLIWLGIWLSFFVCQVVPSLYVAFRLTPALYTHVNSMEFHPSLALSSGLGLVTSAVAAILVALSLNRIKSLSVNFQMDYLKTLTD